MNLNAFTYSWKSELWFVCTTDNKLKALILGEEKFQRCFVELVPHQTRDYFTEVYKRTLPRIFAAVSVHLLLTSSNELIRSKRLQKYSEQFWQTLFNPVGFWFSEKFNEDNAVQTKG